MGRIHRDEPQSSDDHGGPDSPSADDYRAAALYPKKGRRSIQKRVVSVRIGDVEGSRGGGGRGEAYPPSDSWAWRKYGQKPIKGSPYPRAYYRCSSSKGCGAKKQVERSRADPTMLIITYASDHNHPVPAAKHHRTSEAAAAAPATPSTPESPTSSEPAADSDAAAAADSPEEFLSEDRKELLTCAAELGLGGMLIGGWLSDVANEAPSFVGPGLDGDDVSTSPQSVSMEDESMFAELDELPECSIVFRRARGISSRDVASLCGSSG